MLAISVLESSLSSVNSDHGVMGGLKVTTNRTAIYIRVTPEDEDLADQKRELRAYAKSKGLDVVEVYSEKVSATDKVERGTYEQVLEDAADPYRSWDHLLVWSLGWWSPEKRFTRAIAAIKDLEDRGILFHSFQEPMIDSSEDGNPSMGRDLLHALLPVIASFERRPFESQRRSNRVKVAMDELKAGRRRTRSGRPVGRPRRLTPQVAERIRELRNQGLPWTEVAQLVGLPAGTCRKATRMRLQDPGRIPSLLSG